MKNLSKIITQVLSITSFLIFSFWIFSEHVSANSLTEVDLSSNSAWTLSIDGSSTWRSIIVPGGGFNSDQQSPRIDQTTISDHVEYKRSITIPNIASTQVTKLSFGAVNHGAEIYINSTLVGSHVGPMMPFEVDISSYVTPGSTYTLSVKAYDKNHYKNTSNQYTVPVGFYYPYNGNYSANFGLGITKYVKIVAYPQVSIKDVFVRPSVTNQNLFYDVWVDNHSSSAKTVTLQGNLTSWNGDNWTYPSISDTTVNVPGNSVTKVTIGPVSWTLGSTSYWWPNIPFNETYSAKLHNLNLTLKEGTTTWDSKVQRFGFSQYTEGSNYYMINGVRVNHISDGTPESGYSSYDAFSTSAAFLPPTGANTGAPETFKRFMRLGVNTNRIHQSTPTEYMMNAADEVGFMMIPETAMRGYENEVYDAVYSDQAVKDLAQAARNHPSVVRYSLSNEVPVWSQLIDAIQTVDNTRPYVYETSQSNNSPQIINGTVGHAYTMNHYVGYPTPATIISGIGEFAWDNNHNSYDLNTVADQGKDMRKNDIAYFAPWDWINMWPNLLEGMNHNNHAWKNDNHADRVDGVDGWNSNIVNYVQKSFQPYLIMDNGIEASNSYSVNWPSNVPTYSQNGSITRDIVVFNGGLSGNTMKLDWEARWDSPTGTLVTSGSTNNFTLQPGFHTTKSISFTAPIVTAQRKLYLVMKSYLGSTLVNTEDRIYFNIISGQSLTYNDSITGAGVNQFNYVGSWAYTSQVGAYNADNHYSNTGNDYYTFIFNGNQIVLHSINAPNAGIIAVSIDSGAETNIDLYASSRTDDLVVYTSPTLAGSQHTLKVRVTGTKNVSSSAYYGTADRVDVYSNPTTIINDNITGTGNNQFNYVGSWSYGSQTGAYNMDNHYSNTTNDYYTVGFVGTQIVLHSINAPNAGIIAVSIDSGAETNIDLYASSRTDDLVVYTSPTLASSQHTLKVRVTGTKNVSSSAYYGTADRVDIN